MPDNEETKTIELDTSEGGARVELPETEKEIDKTFEKEEKKDEPNITYDNKPDDTPEKSDEQPDVRDDKNDGGEVVQKTSEEGSDKQKNNIKSFLVEVFNGFISWDAKFWKTLIPLLTKPGKVSKDYISGKRSRYSNPFQFYLSVSILFFIILGLTKKYNEFQDFGKKEIDNKFSTIELQNNTGVKKDSIFNEEKTNIFIHY